MNNKLKTLLASAIVALAVGTTYGLSHAASETVRTRPIELADSAVGPAQDTHEVRSVLDDAPCELEAVPVIPATLDPRVAESASITPFSRAWDPAVALGRVAATERAISLSSDRSSITSVAATRGPYSIEGRVLGDASNPLVAPSRCMWLVSVDGMFQSDNQKPGGVVPPPVRGYTVLIDAASGDILDLMAGPTTPSLITGEGVAAPAR